MWNTHCLISSYCRVEEIEEKGKLEEFHSFPHKIPKVFQELFKKHTLWCRQKTRKALGVFMG